MPDDARLAELRRLLAEALMQLWREEAGDLGDPATVTGAGDIASEYADALLPVVSAWAEQDREQHAARRAAEELGEALGEALGKAATLGPLEAVAWMARRHAALTPATEEKR